MGEGGGRSLERKVGSVQEVKNYGKGDSQG